MLPNIHISDYTYNLPEEKIAVYPLSERDKSKLLIWNNGEVSEMVFANIDRALPPKSLLIFNNTRVIHARLHFRRPTGARIEIFCLEPSTPANHQQSLQQTGFVEWKCLIGNSKKWKSGTLELPVHLGGATIVLTAERIEQRGNAFIVRFSWNTPHSFGALLEAAGNIPIPPYLNREAEESDTSRYQTLYARIDGSVAAPTAGLHFTDEVLEQLKNKQILSAELTLHVGAGTFQPVKSERVADHEMHTESVVVTFAFLKQLIEHQHPVVAVGTTSVRSLESLYWLGVLISERAAEQSTLHIGQWDPYTFSGEMTPIEALSALCTWMDKHHLNYLEFTTSVLIMPGYKYRIIQGMVTNFHQPESTLLLLIAAFLGNEWRAVYNYALQNNFRFLSYGDSNLYLKNRDF